MSNLRRRTDPAAKRVDYMRDMEASACVLAKREGMGRFIGSRVLGFSVYYSFRNDKGKVASLGPYPLPSAARMSDR